jgi:NADPH2:quinone reductase
MDGVEIPFRELLFRSAALRFFVVYELLPDDRDATLAALAGHLFAGRLRHVIGARFPLDDIAAAHEAVEGGKVIGNVVLDIP